MERDLAIVLDRLGVFYVSCERHQDAEDALTQAMEFFVREGADAQSQGHRQAGRIVNSIQRKLAGLYGRTGRYDEQEKILLTLLDQEPLHSRGGRPEVLLGSLGELYRVTGRYEDAERVLMDALDIQIRRDPPASWGEVYADAGCGIGDCYLALSQLYREERRYVEAEIVCGFAGCAYSRPGVEDIYMAKLAVELSLIYGDSGRHKQAEQQLGQLQEILEQLDEEEYVADCRRQMASSYVKLDRIDDALTVLNESAVAYAELGLKDKLASSCFDLGTIIATVDGLGDEAANEFASARDIYRELEDEERAADCDLKRGSIFLECGQLDDAECALLAAQRTYSRLMLIKKDADCEWALGLVYSAMGDLQRASAASGSARELYEALGLDVPGDGGES